MEKEAASNNETKTKKRIPSESCSDNDETAQTKVRDQAKKTETKSTEKSQSKTDNTDGEAINVLINKFYRYVIPPSSLIGYGYPVDQGPGRFVIYGTIIMDRKHIMDHKRDSKPIDVPQPLFTPRVLELPVPKPLTFGSYFSIAYPHLGSSIQHVRPVNLYFTPVIEFNHSGAVPFDNDMFNLGKRSTKKICVRCEQDFFILQENGEYVTKENCYYHWGKLMESNMRYNCCNLLYGSKGCEKGNLHVWDWLVRGKINGPFYDYVQTRVRPLRQPYNRSNRILGLDCEMCFTYKGFEVCKVSIVNVRGDLVYSCLIVPQSRVIDYNTRFSGVSAKDYCVLDTSRNGKVIKSLKSVQNDLLNLIYTDTIVVGHGLENDFRALKLVHKNIIDTALVFPHFLGLPYKRSLKDLAMCYLNLNIQDKSDGHNSTEDATACINLMLWKIDYDTKRSSTDCNKPRSKYKKCSD